MRIRKLFAPLLSLALLFSMFCGVASAMVTSDSYIFADVNETTDYYQGIKYLKQNGVVEGYDDGKYKPDNLINRAEFLKILMEAEGYDVGGYSNCYKDVKTEWFAPYVCKATNLGIVKGYSDGYFRPEQNINFAEASKMITNAFKISTSSIYTDSWYHRYVYALGQEKAIPTSINYFDKNVTRAEMAEMVWRIADNQTGESYYTYSQLKEMDEDKIKSIALTALGDNEVAWVTDGKASKGVKVVWAKMSNPTYPPRSNDQSKYSSSTGDSSAILTGFDGAGTYYIRVCEYTGSGCDVYSNQVQMYLDAADGSNVKSISISIEDDGTVSWSVTGDADKGVKVVWSKNTGPTYPPRSGDNSKLVTSGNSHMITAENGAGLYYVRVCEYTGSTCGIYSAELNVQLGDPADNSDVNSITVSDDGDGNVSWTIDGSPPSGVKVVWSKNENPTYPTRTNDRYQYFNISVGHSTTLDAFDGSGEYYVRVCEYLGGSCGVFSNQITVGL